MSENIKNLIEIVKKKSQDGCTNRCDIKYPRKGGLVTNAICDCISRADRSVKKRVLIQFKLKLCDALIEEWERCEQEAAEYATEVHDSARGQY